MTTVATDSEPEPSRAGPRHSRGHGELTLASYHDPCHRHSLLTTARMILLPSSLGVARPRAPSPQRLGRADSDAAAASDSESAPARPGSDRQVQVDAAPPCPAATTLSDRDGPGHSLTRMTWTS